MRRKLLTLLVYCLISTTVTAQETIDCNLNYRLALLYLTDDHGIDKDLEKVKRYLKPCLEAENEKAMALMGRLLIMEEKEDSYTKAYKLLKKASKKEHPIAMLDLATLYKYGWGTTQNFAKARKWYKKSSDLGNDNAGYSLGYLYLKGFGGFAQDYNKAVKWFKKSGHSMARYWLGVCYYFGYGVEQNLNKAKEYLGKDIKSVGSVNLEELNEVYPKILTDYKKYETQNLTKGSLKGSWSGHLVKLDWSGNYAEVAQEIDLIVYQENLEIKTKSTNPKVALDFIGNTIYLENVTVPVSHISFKEEIPDEAHYQFNEITFYKKQFSNQNYLVGIVKATITVFKEPAAPTLLILKQNVQFTNSDESLSADALAGLAGQQDDFIKLYPNPLKDQLIVSYELKQSSNVAIYISDVQGTYNHKVEEIDNQEKGTHHYLFNGSQLQKGLYIVSVYVNGERKTKTIVKN